VSRRLVAEHEQNGLFGSASLDQGREHGPGALREVPFGRHGRAEIRERFYGAQKPPKIILVQCHADEWRKTRATSE
jgi:hypothetical protein